MINSRLWDNSKLSTGRSIWAGSFTILILWNNIVKVVNFYNFLSTYERFGRWALRSLYLLVPMLLCNHLPLRLGGPSNLLLRNKLRQKWWDVTSGIRLHRDCGFHRGTLLLARLHRKPTALPKAILQRVMRQGCRQPTTLDSRLATVMLMSFEATFP